MSEIINISPADQTGVLRECEPGELLSFTHQGWRLVAMYPVTVQMPCPPPLWDPNTGRTTPSPPPVYGTGFRCLIRQDEESILAEKTRQIEALSSRCSAVDEALRKEKEAREESEKKLSNEQSTLASFRTSYDGVTKQLEALRASSRRAEVDLGKLRKEIGEREFTRIVGETK